MRLQHPPCYTSVDQMATDGHADYFQTESDQMSGIDWNSPDSIAEELYKVESERDDLKTRLERLEASLQAQGKTNAYPELDTPYHEDDSLSISEKIKIAESRNEWGLVGRYKDQLLAEQTFGAAAVEQMALPGAEFGARDESGNLLSLQQQIAQAEAEGDWLKSGMLKDRVLKLQAEEQMRVLDASQGGLTHIDNANLSGGVADGDGGGEGDGESAGAKNVAGVDQAIEDWRERQNRPIPVEEAWARSGVHFGRLRRMG